MNWEYQLRRPDPLYDLVNWIDPYGLKKSDDIRDWVDLVNKWRDLHDGCKDLTDGDGCISWDNCEQCCKAIGLAINPTLYAVLQRECMAAMCLTCD